MDHHQTPSFVDRHPLLLDILIILGPAVATGVNLLVLLNWEDVGIETGRWRPAFTMAFFLFPSLAAFVTSWWHPAPTATFRPFLAAVPQLLVVPLTFLMFLWVESDPEPGFGLGDPGFGLTEAEKEETLVANIISGSIIGLLLTMPAVLAGYMGTWLGQSSRRGREGP